MIIIIQVLAIVTKIAHSKQAKMLNVFCTAAYPINFV